MEDGGRLTGRSAGNTSGRRAVARGEDLPTLDSSLDPEDFNITTWTSPASMTHAARYDDAGWVEPTDEPFGTAVFDATGDKAAMPSWDELVRQHADRVYRLAYRLSGSQQDAEDLTQETFIRVFRSVQNYQPGTFEGWLHRITTNLFLDMVRRRARIRMEALPEDYDRVPADEPNPEQIYHDARLAPDLQAGHCAQPHPPRTPGAARLPRSAFRPGRARTGLAARPRMHRFGRNRRSFTAARKCPAPLCRANIRPSNAFHTGVSERSW
jgi:RNA polymerase sigma-70 factor (ECF subfamily)